jgi:hypothetical protein
VRREFVDGARGKYWDQFKHPIHVDQATIAQRTVYGGLPPQQESGSACAAIVHGGHRQNVQPNDSSGCVAHRSPIGARNIGRIRLGYNQRRLLRGAVQPVRRTPRSFRYCVRGTKGRVSAVFSPRGRVLLVATTASTHGNRKVRPGASARSLRAYPRRVLVGRGLFRAHPGSTLLIGVRRGTVRFVAVADKSLLASPRNLRRYLQLAGL